MKRVVFIISLIIININIFSQNSLELKFASRCYGETVMLDSVLIKNINRNCDTVIYYPDTTLLILFTVGIEEKMEEDNFSVSQNFPNPIVNGKTSFEISLPENDLLKIRVLNMNGRLVTEYSGNLNAGMHRFDYFTEGRESYLITTNTSKYFQSIKIISLQSNTDMVSKIKHVSFIEKSIIHLKTRQMNSGFWFEPGDTLWYVGYAKTPEFVSGSDVVESAPFGDTLIRFSIIEGIPCSGTEAVKYGEHLYPTVQIENQCWLKENLNIGTMILGDSNMLDNGIVEKFCYDNINENCLKYGGLYQWDELMNYSNEEEEQGICPENWHISKDNDWKLITNTHSADELKERGIKHWLPGNNANNSSGFTALPAGYRSYDGSSFEMLQEGNGFFTSLEYDLDNLQAMDRTMYYSSSWILGGPKWKTTGKSVRCVRD